MHHAGQRRLAVEEGGGPLGRQGSELVQLASLRVTEIAGINGNEVEELGLARGTHDHALRNGALGVRWREGELRRGDEPGGGVRIHSARGMRYSRGRAREGRRLNSRHRSSCRKGAGEPLPEIANTEIGRSPRASDNRCCMNLNRLNESGC